MKGKLVSATAAKGAMRGILSLALATTSLSIATISASRAQDTEAGTLLEEVLVTATKQSRAQEIQKVPVTISAFSGDQIEKMKITNIQNLAYSMPNVGFDTPGSTKSTANFTIRGLGLNSSIASSTPTVGVFVNGVFMGVNQGVLVDTFDLEGIEVLRGPQSTLFGKNVTGGAVLLNWRKPQQQPDGLFRVRYETGPQYSFSGAGGGGITDNLAGRIAFLYRKDEGYFNNVTLHDKNFGKDETIEVRPSLRYKGSSTDVTIFGEYGQETGDGPVTIAPDYTGGSPAAAAFKFPPRGRSDKNYEDFRGLTDMKWYGATLQGTQDVDFGTNGQIALIAGVRKLDAFSQYASDGTELTVSHNAGYTLQDQFSTELRYNGTFGITTVTVGGYFFHQNFEQLNEQYVINSTQGGKVRENDFAVFGQADIKLTQDLILQLGGRWNSESKAARIAALANENPLIRQPGTFGIPGSCSLAARTCNYPYSLSKTWYNFTPKIGLQYQLTDTIQVYATAQKAARSGGFNVRYNGASAPTPYGLENQEAYELGFKSDLFDHKTRLNADVFLTQIKGLQRDITLFDSATLANVTRTLNTADAETQGAEVEWVQRIVPGVVFNANAGYVGAHYTSIKFDLTGDGRIDALDYIQRLPRVSPWSTSMGLTASHDFSFGAMTFRADYSHRDQSYFPDNNNKRSDGANPKLPAANLVNAQVEWQPYDSNFSITVYGENLANQYTLAAFTPIVYPKFKGCSCLPSKGRVIGVEGGYQF